MNIAYRLPFYSNVSEEVVFYIFIIHAKILIYSKQNIRKINIFNNGGMIQFTHIGGGEG